ncbi:hypothetical protein EDD80_10290 [Anseongella ginsenosidimutans]|uniref:CAAX prenyl protease 2/Lysostaphin resistance protein A-like domain-containing protein n=1 Tax=Anseongella ginsenosidimutans TaxID=496056 RepID=A0A4R3KWP9_9SPHI|nr:CPBP family intramembrane glutamic endopeptidase [Anseongella ginsenosidimutans]TCS88900.1 hypothetical protein EDD80_10290 [Anseongella ginsenosidimutans]
MDRKGFLYYTAPWLHFLFLAGLTLCCIFVFSALSIMAVPFLFDMSFTELMESMGNISGENIEVLKFMQVTQSVGMFVIPPLIYFRLAGLRGKDYLTSKKERLPLFLLLALALGFVSAPMIELSYQLNQLMDLPPFLDGLEAWMRESEDTMEELTKVLLTMNGWTDFAVNMLMIAVIPAIGEELMFRGALQGIFSRWFGNVHWAIFITAILFSFIHMQFFGFLPRFLLGLLFGYLFYWSGNIWVPIATHFLNNGMIVLLNFLFQQKISNFDPGQEQDFSGLQYLFSAVLTLALLAGFYSLARKNAEHKLNEQ